MESYTLATKHKESGAIVWLDIPHMTMAQAVKHRDNLLALLPDTPLFVINTKAI